MTQRIGKDGRMIENTTKTDPWVHLMGALGNPDGFIEDQEARGQEQLVNSVQLPSKVYSPEQEFLDLGFEFGEPLTNDPLFRPATLPEGWSKQSTDHSMWTKIVDERGIERVSIFYKAAFYDRDAFMRMSNVGASVASHYIYDDNATEFTVPEGLTEEETTAVREYAERYILDSEELVAMTADADRPYPDYKDAPTARARQIVEALT